MRIVSKEELSKFIFGAVSIMEEDGWFRFSRFTETQCAWLATHGFPRDRYSTSGMRLEFMTRGGQLSFDYQSEQSSNGNVAIFGIEITVNGMPAFHIYKEELPTLDRIEFEIPEHCEDVHVAVYFPLRATLKIKNVVLPADSKAVKKELKILTLGDSITAGAVCRHSNHCYVNILADKLNAQLINQGVGGACFSPEFLEELQFRPDIVTVAYGVNDFSANSLFTETPCKFFEKLCTLYPDSKLFCLLPIWCGNQKSVDGKTLDMGRQYIKEIAEKYQNISVIDCVNFVPHLAEFYWDDINLHPNDLGFLYYGNHLYKRLAELL